MDLITLDPTTHRPKKLVENWSSLIWTERYDTYGDFQLVTSDVEAAETLLASDTLVSLMDTEETMIVEDVTYGDDDKDALTIVGRSYASVLERRANIVNDAGDPGTYSAAKAGEYLRTLINTRIAKTTRTDVTPQAQIVSEGIPNVYCVDNTSAYLTVPEDPFPDLGPGDVSTTVLNILKQNNLGISSKRPLDTTSSDIRIMINIGFDRSGQSAATPTAPKAIFSFLLGDLMNHSYISSTKDYRNVAYVNSPLGFRVVYPAGVPESSGLNRRVLQVDATDLDDPGSLSVDDAITVRGRLELSKHNRFSIVDGQISPAAKYIFRGPDPSARYDLGDIISLVGKPNIPTVRRVTEYIRSQSKTGEKSYPTMVELDS